MGVIDYTCGRIDTRSSRSRLGNDQNGLGVDGPSAIGIVGQNIDLGGCTYGQAHRVIVGYRGKVDDVAGCIRIGVDLSESNPKAIVRLSHSILSRATVDARAIAESQVLQNQRIITGTTADS